MSNKIHKKVFKNPITSKVFTILGFLPILALTAIFSMFTLFPQTKVSAAPSSPTNPSLSITVDTAANIHFNATDLNNSAFKSQAFGVKVTTDCRTGYTISLSDQDEDTNLKSANPLNTTNITSITADTAAANFTAGTWGYSIDNTTFKPIAKKSAPVAVKTTNTPTPATGESTSIFLGVKSAATLPTDTYSDILEVSVVTNYVPNTATFLDGNAFSTLINTNILANTNNLRLFQKSPTPPAAVFATANVASADSELPIYLWYDPAQKCHALVDSSRTRLRQPRLHPHVLLLPPIPKSWPPNLPRSTWHQYQSRHQYAWYVLPRQYQPRLHYWYRPLRI